VPGVRLTAIATADPTGMAEFLFPAVPNGRVWTGTVNIPAAPNTAQTSVAINGLTIGTTYGINGYGPVQCYRSETLVLGTTGLDPFTQYTAVWVIADEAEGAAQQPPIAYGSILQINNTVVNPVSVSVVSLPPPPGTFHLSTLLTMTGSPVAGPSVALTVGVSVLCPTTNKNPINVGASSVSAASGLLSPGQGLTIPVDNADIVYALGTGPDVLSMWGA
jgi:hypothetical protein